MDVELIDQGRLDISVRTLDALMLSDAQFGGIEVLDAEVTDASTEDLDATPASPHPSYELLSCLPENCDLEWVSVSSALIMIGDQRGRADERPTRSIRVNAFQVSREEVTVSQYSRCVKDGLCPQPMIAQPMVELSPPSQCNWFLPARGDHPMNCVSNCEAQRFADYIEGRLLSEVEWERLAKQRDYNEYPWGEDSVTCEHANTIDCVVVRRVDGGDEPLTTMPLTTVPLTTVPSCSLTAGVGEDFEVCDLVGNVSEWVSDAYHPSYEGAPWTQDAWDPITECNSTQVGVIRGGGWRLPASNGRSVNRTAWVSDERADHVGFRVARPIRF
jgi:formylglycine-generating enzyme required for sulfatase activity